MSITPTVLIWQTCTRTRAHVRTQDWAELHRMPRDQPTPGFLPSLRCPAPHRHCASHKSKARPLSSSQSVWLAFSPSSLCCGGLEPNPLHCQGVPAGDFYFPSLPLPRAEKNIRGLPPVCSLIGEPTHTPGMCPGWELNLRPFGLLGNAPHTRPELLFFTLCFCCLVFFFNQKSNASSYPICNPSDNLVGWTPS